MSREALQLLKHKYYLRTVPITLARWAKYIPEQQSEDIQQVIASHEHAYMGILPPDAVPDQNFYRTFFSRVRDIKGLKW